MAFQRNSLLHGAGLEAPKQSRRDLPELGKSESSSGGENQGFGE
jgi:hypothetical protein